MKIGKNFTKVPNEWVYDPNLTSGEFRTLVALLSFGFADNPSFPSQQTVADKIGKTARTICAHVKTLRKKGYLMAKRRGFNKSNQYNFLSVRKKSSHMRGKNLPHNNTSNKTNNNISINAGDKRKGMQHIREVLGYGERKLPK
ncbi:helix-turn-helix domain-containing protein [bacterium]|nr:helix-turn-helix domain-containing protein [bacterium]